MASLELLNGNTDEVEEGEDPEVGGILWEDEDLQEAEGNFAHAALTSLGGLENKRRGGVGRAFEHMKRLLAGSEVEAPDYPHTLIAFRDSGYEALKDHEKKSMDLDTERGKATATAVMSQHYLEEYVPTDFIDGKTDAHEMLIPTLADDLFVRILPPRVPKDNLPAGARVEEPIIILETARGTIVKQTTARRTYEKNSDGNFQQIIVVPEPLAKWVAPRNATTTKK